LVSNLTDKGLSGYLGCLKDKNNLTIDLSSGASGKIEFIVDLAWRPHYSAPNPAKVAIVMLNVTSKGAPNKIRFGTSEAFSVKRTDLYKPVEINIHVDGQPYPTISLPAIPDKTLKKLL
jgi:hypothetical protein